MKAFVIWVLDNVDNADRCIKSAKHHLNKFDVRFFRGYQSEVEVNDYFKRNNLTWNYPWDETEHDASTGLTKTPYPTVTPWKRMGCFASHYELWKTCTISDEAFLILEHDALFTGRLDLNYLFVDSDWENKDYIVGINDPRGATRRAHVFHQKICDSWAPLQEVPKVDTPDIPQGLGGNSAYIITPSAAKKVIALVDKYGAWPNDAIMCYQLLDCLYVSKEYYTTVQRLKSTTSC